MRLSVGQRVRIKEDASVFARVAGTIDFPPDAVLELDAEAWIGPFKYEKRRKGTVIVYWVVFDEPADDGSGDGPYTGASVAEKDLQTI